jgi:hypothetical protein
MGGKPSKGTSKDMRLSTNKGKGKGSKSTSTGKGKKNFYVSGPVR